jgi:hypothetical protein
MRRQLLRLETPAIESHLDLSFLHGEEKRQLKTGDCRCYLARDPRGAVTLFLALSFGTAGKNAVVVNAEYSRSLDLGQGRNILRESGMNDPDRDLTGTSQKQVTNRAETVPDRRKR